MFKILQKTFRTGIVTEKYPAKRFKLPEGFRGKPVFDPDKCTFCGECAGACPPEVIRLCEENNEKILSITCCGCIFCGRCEEVCAYGAVKLTGEFEMASRTKHDLAAEIRRKV